MSDIVKKESLTKKEEAFCYAFAKTGRLEQSFSRIFFRDRPITQVALYKEAVKLINRPEVAQKINDITSSYSTGDHYTRDHSLAKLMEMRDMAIEDRAYMPAFKGEELIMKMNGWITNVNVNLNKDITLTPEQASQQLQGVVDADPVLQHVLKNMLPVETVIDADFSEVTSPEVVGSFVEDEGGGDGDEEVTPLLLSDGLTEGSD